MGANASTVNSKLYMTQDGGRTWQQQKLVLPAGYSDGKLDVVAPPMFFSPDSKEGILMTTFVPKSHKAIECATIFYITQDGGLTWQSRKPVQAEGIAVDFVNTNEWWYWRSEPRDTGSTAPVQGKLYHTIDGGKTWSEISPDKTLQEYSRRGKTSWILTLPTTRPVGCLFRQRILLRIYFLKQLTEEILGLAYIQNDSIRITISYY